MLCRAVPLKARGPPSAAVLTLVPSAAGTAAAAQAANNVVLVTGVLRLRRQLGDSISSIALYKGPVPCWFSLVVGNANVMLATVSMCAYPTHTYMPAQMCRGFWPGSGCACENKGAAILDAQSSVA
jgi:hypothetical protein